jgi:DNA-directed RNA polymerase beta subunit
MQDSTMYKFAAAGDELDDNDSAPDTDEQVPDSAEDATTYTEDVSDFDDLHPILNDAASRRDRMRKQAILSVQKIFPIEAKNYTVSVEDVRIDEQYYTLNEQRTALLARESLVEPIKVTIVITDKRDNKVVSKSKRTLGYLPWMSPRHTFVMDGNEFSVANQLRVKPGVYTRTRANGELESHFNLGRGANFRIIMSPASGIFNLQYESSQIPLYPILRALGKNDTDIANAWGRELLSANQTARAANGEAAVNKLYRKIIHPSQQLPKPTYAEMASAIAEAYDRTRMNAEVTRTTLQDGKGPGFDRVNADAMLAASVKLARVFKKEIPEDDRDALEFKTLHTADTFVKERIEKDAARALQFKVKTKLNRTSAPTVSSIIPSVPLSKPLRSLITQSSLSQIPSQINPVEILDGAVKVTSLGEGGIGSLRAVPETTREQHGSHRGVLDPVRTPESGGVGVDLRAAAYAAVDKQGNLNAPLINARTGKTEYVPVTIYSHKNVAFREVDMKKPRVPVMNDNRMLTVLPKDVDYILTDPTAMFSPATSLVPMLDGAQGNRNIMGSKFQTQAVPLVAREAPLVQAQAGLKKGLSMESVLAKWHLPMAPGDGVVTEIDTEKTQIVIKLDDGKEARLDYADNFPFASKTRLHHTLLVKVGDRVKKDQHLADSNYTRGGELALGTNMRVAYVAYEGLNTNDAVVISEGAARKLTSEHQYKTIVHRHENLTLSRDLHKKYFGAKYSSNTYNYLDADGLPKKGTIVHPGELIVAAIEKKKTNADDAMLGKLSRSLVQPFRDASETWDHSYPGEIVEVVKTNSSVVVLVNTLEPMGIGDKLAGRFGNKGVVSRIVPDDQMFKDEAGDTIEVLYTSAGVSTRINPNQVIETALGKVAKKTGQPIVLEQFEDVDRVQWAMDLLKKHDVKDKETVTDPLTGRKIHGILVGQQHTFKMFKSSETNFSTRSIGGYDANAQPTKGGDAGAKAIGRMDYLALLAHDARANIQEISTVKSTQNDEYWKRVQLGQPVVQPGTSFAFKKLLAMTQGAGINTTKTGSQFALSPMTDDDVDKLASSEVLTATVVKVKSAGNAVNVLPEKGGLFDPAITGGLRGQRWSKVTLAEPVVNPVFEKAARELLSLNGREFEQLMYRDGGAEVKRRLNAIDTVSKIKQLEDQIEVALDAGRENDVDLYVRQLKYLRALKQRNLKAGDAYVITKVPVIPPVMRPLTSGADGKVLVSDPNFLYKDLLLVNQTIRNTPGELRELDDTGTHRRTLHHAVRAVYGTADPVNEKTKARGARGFLQQISGQNSPKTGFFHSRIIGRRQDLSGRGTIAPDPTLELDQIGIPVDMLWKQFEPFLIRSLVLKGYTPLDAQKMIKDRTPTAQQALTEAIKTRPVIVNRAPTLHRYSLLAAYARPIEGNTIRLNPFAEIGMNADYDGDAIQVHVPVSDRAVTEAQNMTLSKLIYADGGKNELNVKPQHEAIIGVYMATRHNTPNSNKAPVKFKTKADAVRAYHENKIDINTPIEIEDKSAMLGQYLRNPTRRESNLSVLPASGMAPPRVMNGGAAPPMSSLPGQHPTQFQQ